MVRPSVHPSAPLTTLSKTNARLPLPTESENNKYYKPETGAIIRKVLIRRSILDWNFAAPVYMHAGAWWTRCSAQIWNEASIPLLNGFHFLHYTDVRF